MVLKKKSDHDATKKSAEPQAKKQKVVEEQPQPTATAAAAGDSDSAAAKDDSAAASAVHQQKPPSANSNMMCCAGCGVSEGAAAGPLLLFEDPEEDVAVPQDDGGKKPKEECDEKRFCAKCMTGKKVRVFWPVDSQWYIADVQQFDTNTGEHLLRYPDGDTEWVRIGEDHTTNTQYKEYFKNQGNLARLPSLGGGNTGMSFGLSAMSQSFGMPTTAEDEKTMQLKGPHTSSSHQQQRLFQQLNFDRTSSSMSSFGMYNPGVGPRQMSFGQPPPHPPHPGPPGSRAPPFQILSPNFSHSFSSKIGTVPSLDFGPPPPHPGASSKGPPPQHHHHPYPPHHPQSREEGNGANLGATSPGRRDEPSQGWPPQHQYPPNHGYYDGGGHQQQQQMMPYPYPPPPPSSDSPYNSKPKAPTSTPKSSSPKSSKKERDKSKKALAKAWAKAEDEHLLDLVLQMKHPLKWSIIAQSLSDFSAATGAESPLRTGKQCRERYVNHLNPRLKHSEFSPLEDATIWRLYATIGSQWAKMSKVIPGRTDNNLKNRFHNLKRQLIRDEESRSRSQLPEDYNELVYSERVRDLPQFTKTRIEDMWNHSRNLGMISASSAVQESRDDNDATAEGGDSSTIVGAEAVKLRKFGPFETVTEPLQCGRCGLFMPSAQCGTEMCTKTKWCRVCTKVSMHLGGGVLRECMNLRKAQDKALVAGVDNMMAEIWGGK